MSEQSKSPYIQPVKASDTTLELLVNERRREVERLQKREAEQLNELERRGQAQLNALKATLSKEQAELIEQLSQSQTDQAQNLESEIEKLRSELADATPSELMSAAPLNSYGLQVAAAVGFVNPYYATVHNSNGTIYWQGYLSYGQRINLSTSCSGSGSGILGTGACSGSMYIDWWFNYRPSENRFYAHNIYMPFRGFHIVKADDTWLTSKEARVSINIAAQAYQYNWKSRSETNVLNISDDNINVNDRYDNTRTWYHSELLGGGDTAYLLVTCIFSVYARGSGSRAELNFAAENANYVGAPYIYVS